MCPKKVTCPDLLVYGGSFDPPHLGHFMCAKLARAIYPQTKILILPSYCPPSAAGKSKILATSFEHRLAMVRINFEELLEDAHVEISTIESSLGAPNYTLNTLHALSQRIGMQRLDLLIGSDQLQNLKNWYGAKELMCDFGLLIIPRGTHDFHFCRHELLKTTEFLGLACSPAGCAGRFEIEGAKHDILIASEALSDAASSIIRSVMDPNEAANQIIKNAEIKKWMNPRVLEYIAAQGLYARWLNHC